MAKKRKSPQKESSSIKKFNYILLYLLPWIIVFSVTEIVFRFLPDNYFGFRVSQDERSLAYRYDETLGWFPIPNGNQEFNFNRKFTAHHNSKGFRDIEHGP